MNGDKGKKGMIAYCPDCNSNHIVYDSLTDDSKCLNCGWSTRLGGKMNDTIYVSEEDKKELLRCACGLDYILSKYPWRDENNPHFVPMVARCKSEAHQLLQHIDCLLVQPPLFKKETIYEDPEWKNKESR